MHKFLLSYMHTYTLHSYKHTYMHEYILAWIHTCMHKWKVKNMNTYMRISCSALPLSLGCAVVKKEESVQTYTHLQPTLSQHHPTLQTQTNAHPHLTLPHDTAHTYTHTTTWHGTHIYHMTLHTHTHTRTFHSLTLLHARGRGISAGEEGARGALCGGR